MDVMIGETYVELRCLKTHTLLLEVGNEIIDRRKRYFLRRSPLWEREEIHTFSVSPEALVIIYHHPTKEETKEVIPLNGFHEVNVIIR